MLNITIIIIMIMIMKMNYHQFLIIKKTDQQLSAIY